MTKANLTIRKEIKDSLKSLNVKLYVNILNTSSKQQPAEAKPVSRKFYKWKSNSKGKSVAGLKGGGANASIISDHSHAYYQNFRSGLTSCIISVPRSRKKLYFQHPAF